MVHFAGWMSSQNSPLPRGHGNLRNMAQLHKTGIESGETNGEGNLSEVVGRLTRWFDGAARDLPWRRTRDPYAIWISEVMLQQTQVQTVIPYWTRWMERLPTIQALADAPAGLVLKLWEGLGYYSRARNLQRAACQIMSDHGGRFPRDPKAILALPGIGPYTAGAIASISLNQPEPILDGNVIRVLTRLFALEGDPKAKPLNRRLWALAAQLVESAHAQSDLGDQRCSRLNQAMMELGATICTPGGQPACGMCPVAGACTAHQQGVASQFPELPDRVPITARFFATGILEHEGRYLVTLRENTDVNRGFWEFPNWETAASDDAESVLSEQLGVPRAGWSAWPDLRHHITRYRMTQRVRLACFLPPQDRTVGTWLWATITELESLALTAAHRKLARKLQHASRKRPQLS